ncbi:FdhF/YdeP family oxidoreductase [Microbacterium horticulturae]|uniref:FdhF/YdeP family oxidoreductase n=1 Tax=Microbacterium horticulturae TaxID=3028316 RepID=A0ABY8BZV5_9MICO|nr:FdhF/YdeP family oxidoreductase [Microbacterium sp. KACC 23027]WEG09741.1 FdhF/YdeP family oxidoreductase [Microbacterium sp. KACC 23027]
MTAKAPVQDVTESATAMEVAEPRLWAAGVPGITHAMGPAMADMGVGRALTLLTDMNQKDGFDCMSCAWADPEERKTFEFCENGAKAVTWEATPVTIPTSFWAENSISSLQDKSEYWLGMQGRLIEPLYKPTGEDNYRPITWDEAFTLIGDRLKAMDSPNEATFYTSGRTANETAFAYQLFAREMGTNNLPDCSNMCHESTGLAMGQTIGIGKNTIAYKDFAKADLIIIMGQNPGTNHPRMLTALEEAKEAGAEIVAINPLLEAGLIRYKNPQKVKGIIGHGTGIADQYLQIRAGGDGWLMKAISQRVFAAEDAKPGTVLDHAFLDEHCQGLDEFRASLKDLDPEMVLRATGLTTAQIDELAERYLRADKVIITWAMGLTQHRDAVSIIKEVINLLLLRGNIGKPGAGASPIRGHSNVQGDRTMGIWEQMPPKFLDALQREFGFDPPRENGYDVVQAVEAMREGKTKVWISMGGNLVSAVSDTHAAEEGFRKVGLNVQVSTKLNRNHLTVGDEAIILPVLGRTEIDMQEAGPQMLTVEDSVCAIHSTRGKVKPISDKLRSEMSVVVGIARAYFGDTGPVDWASFEKDYDVVRDHIEHVIPGFTDFNKRLKADNGFILPHGPRDSRTFPTATGKAMITVNDLEYIERPPGRLLLQSMRAHDQFNTTIYSLNDRYRGIKRSRRVIFVHPDDLAELGIEDGSLVDVHSEFADGVDRSVHAFKAVAFPTSRGCAATYFPEGNPLVPLSFTALGSNTPASKSVVVRLEPVTEAVVSA